MARNKKNHNAGTDEKENDSLHCHLKSKHGHFGQGLHLFAL